MIDRDAKQYIVMASHPIMDGDQIFTTFAESDTDAFNNIKRALRGGPPSAPINSENSDLLNLKVVGVQTKNAVVLGKNGNVVAWTIESPTKASVWPE